VITARPVAVNLRRTKKTRIREKLWDAQSRSVKTAVISLFFLLVAGSVYYYNLFITESYYVRLETAQVEAEIQRKNVLIPDLAKVVEDYMKYEGKVFIHAVDVRRALAPLKEASSDGTLPPMDMTSIKTAISKFQAVAEKYPELKSSETFQKLMLELANTETRLTIARNRHNIVVNQYNTSLELFPGGLFGYVLGFKPAIIFVADKHK
jgi:LemA protein